MTLFYSSPPFVGKWSVFFCFLASIINLSALAETPFVSTATPAHLRTEKAFAETTISGRVTDATTNEALAGCSVLLKGTQKGTTTDANGDYKIVVPDGNAVLIFGFIGFVSQEVNVGNRSTINVALKAAASELSQVVVIGYGSASKKDMTGSVKSIKSTDFNRGIINSPEQLLQGKVAGVNVTSASGEPGSVQNITIRGPGGVRTGSTPLFVLDGIALDNSSTGGATNPLNFLNPQDIESIDVLKDASATAIYGSRGANGVVLITTKKGKAGSSTFTISSNLGISNLARPLPVFSADE
ncbi:MAG: TonB-dependent receptor, partial [Spirosoma sp.]|nr:TonB-dependent receptor [Spirosoma sp.]